MVERLPDMPAETLGFRAAGEIKPEDYTEVLEPELRKAIEAGTGLRTLYVIESLDKMEPSAVWEDAKLGFDLGVQHRAEWKRSAIVTDIEWVARATRAFLWMIPGEARLYPLAELDAAKEWVAG